jgi:trk system potassium uptake protein TrkH
LINPLRPIVVRARALYRSLSPSQAVVLGYASYTLITLLLLSMPLMTQPGVSVTWLDHAFMAVSSVSTAGMATVPLSETYNFWGQLVILVALQVGGLGYMTFGSFVIMASGGRLTPSRLRIGRSILTMPDHFDPMVFLRHGLYFTIAVQVAAAAALYWAFSRAGVESPLWPAIFHSVSSYCTAGISIFPNGLQNYTGDYAINSIIALTSFLGAIGFIVVTDVYSWARGHRPRITFTTRIILMAAFGALFVGTLLLALDSHLATMSWADRLLIAFFQAMAAQTTVGFNTVSLDQLSNASVMVMLVLMILGASPSGTGGGLKSTTWSAALGACWSTIRGRTETTFLGCTVPSHRIQAAFATFTLYMIIFAAGSFTLLLLEKQEFEDLIFEAACALSTAGMSRGITPELTDAGKLTIMALMFIGRAGVVSLGLAALANPTQENETPPPVEDMVVG